MKHSDGRTQLAAVEALNIVDEYMRARQKFPDMRSAHEGYAIIKEEFDELWEEVRRWQPRPEEIYTHELYLKKKEYDANIHAMRKEAIQLGAMVLAFLIEVVWEK